LPQERTEGRLWLLAGFLLGAGFLTKGTVYLMAPLIGLVCLRYYWGRWRALLRALLAVFGPALLLGALWWGRNLLVYGGLDLLGKAAHDAVVIGQPRTADWIAQYGLPGTVGRLLRTTFISFWGQFGWMALPLRGWTLAVVSTLSLLALTGLLLGWLGRKGESSAGRRDGAGNDRFPAPAALPAAVLLLTFLLALGLYLWYNLTFVQHQGRYLYPALIPIAIGFVSGLAFWLRPLRARQTAAGYLLPLGLASLLLPLALYSLFRIIVPLF
jgi:4-amino-4-deoxy-L-arabinose transferase-like glycosyltransferase